MKMVEKLLKLSGSWFEKERKVGGKSFGQFFINQSFNEDGNRFVSIS